MNNPMEPAKKSITAPRGTRQHALAGILATVALLLTWSPLPAPASEQSELLTANGLSEFKAEHYAAAAALFDDAVKADASDPFPLYYRGVTLTRLGEYDRAIADLERFLEARPDEEQATLELGVALVSARRYADAQTWLQRAQASPELSTRASFFLGLAQLRLDQHAPAKENFMRAAQDEDLLLASRFYLGIIHFAHRDWNAAEECFTYVFSASPNSDMGNEARKYVEYIDRTRSTYHLYGSLGLLYDSNVVLAPTSDSDAVAISGKDDGLVTITAGGSYTPWQSDVGSTSLGYEFYQSLHFDLSEYDLQDHRLRLEYARRFRRWELGLAGQYDFYLLDLDSLLQQPAVTPWLRFSEGEIGYTELFYWFRWRDYLDESFEDDLDALRQSTGLRQYLYLASSDRKGWVEYRFDRNSALHAEGRRFAYNRNQVGVGIDWRWRSLGVESSLGYWYNHDNFDSPSAPEISSNDGAEPSAGTGERGDERVDNRHTVSISLRKRFTKHVAVRCGYDGIFNNSNQRLFKYNRNIASLVLEVDF